MKAALSAILCGIVALALTGQAAASNVLFNSDNGGTPTGGNNPEAQGFFVAQHFDLSSSSTLDGFVFNAFTRSNTLPITAMDINIYSDVGNSPGIELYSGSFASDSSSVTGTCCAFTLVNYHATLPNWQLSAGDYFIALNVQPNQWDMHWSIATSPTLPGENFISQSGAPGSYSPYQYNQIFCIEGVGNAVAPGNCVANVVGGSVPEPATWAILIVGVGMIGIVARRRREGLPVAA